MKTVTRRPSLAEYIALANTVSDPEPVQWLRRDENSSHFKFRFNMTDQGAQRIRGVLRAIASASKSGAQQVRITGGWLKCPDFIEIDERGRLRWPPDEFFWSFLEALRGEDADRIRTCPACQRFFWAKSRKKAHCTDACRLSHWRETHPDKYPEYYAQYELRMCRREARLKKNPVSIKAG